MTLRRRSWGKIQEFFVSDSEVDSDTLKKEELRVATPFDYLAIISQGAPSRGTYLFQDHIVVVPLRDGPGIFLLSPYKDLQSLKMIYHNNNVRERPLEANGERGLSIKIEEKPGEKNREFYIGQLNTKNSEPEGEWDELNDYDWRGPTFFRGKYDSATKSILFDREVVKKMFATIFAMGWEKHREGSTESIEIARESGIQLKEMALRIKDIDMSDSYLRQLCISYPRFEMFAKKPNDLDVHNPAKYLYVPKEKGRRLVYVNLVDIKKALGRANISGIEELLQKELMGEEK
jgi:hypothetical protein